MLHTGEEIISNKLQGALTFTLTLCPSDAPYCDKRPEVHKVLGVISGRS